jgi:hypothetical protein
MNIHDAAPPREKRCALLQAVVTPSQDRATKSVNLSVFVHAPFNR